ncbi:MAG: DUF1697 domain-containing protein [Gaiellaceae bacterium]
MTQYVAFPRGINAGHRMTMAELRAVFESLGYDGVRTVLASGNVLFQSKRRAEATVIRDIEQALSEAFGAHIATVLRAMAELERLIDAAPFAKVELGPKIRPHVTFLKRKPPAGHKLPQSEGYRILGIVDRTVCSVVDLSAASSSDLMRVLDKELGTDVTTRGWSTVEKVVRAASTA